MTRYETRILNMLISVRQWMLTRIAAFPAGSRGHELYLTIDTSIKNMERHSTEQTRQEAGASCAERGRVFRLPCRAGKKVLRRAAGGVYCARYTRRFGLAVSPTRHKDVAPRSLALHKGENL